MSVARWLALAFWTVVGCVAAWFFVSDLMFVAGRDPAEQGGRWFGYLAHVLSALPVLVIAPLQFVGALRRKRPELHRWLGRAFLGSAMLCGCLAIFLGATMLSEGTQLPLMLFGALWVCFSAIAWQAARRRDYATHRQFVIRSFALATSFLWLHLFQEGEEWLFGFLQSPELRYATRGWLSVVFPLLAAEAYLSWWPAARRVFAKR